MPSASASARMLAAEILLDRMTGPPQTGLAEKREKSSSIPAKPPQASEFFNKFRRSIPARPCRNSRLVSLGSAVNGACSREEKAGLPWRFFLHTLLSCGTRGRGADHDDDAA